MPYHRLLFVIIKQPFQCVHFFGGISADQGLTTRTVQKEFQEGIKRNLFLETDTSWLRKTDLESHAEQAQFLKLLGSLDAGEASCLSVAIHRNHNLLTDDLDARQLARWEGIGVSGSVGVLLSLVKATEISLQEGNQVLKKFINTGYFSPVEILDDLI